MKKLFNKVILWGIVFTLIISIGNPTFISSQSTNTQKEQEEKFKANKAKYLKTANSNIKKELGILNKKLIKDKLGENEKTKRKLQAQFLRINKLAKNVTAERLISPFIENLSSDRGESGEHILITGKRFFQDQGQVKIVTPRGDQPLMIGSWGTDAIVVEIPTFLRNQGSFQGEIYVECRNGRKSNKKPFIFIPGQHVVNVITDVFSVRGASTNDGPKRLSGNWPISPEIRLMNGYQIHDQTTRIEILRQEGDGRVFFNPKPSGTTTAGRIGWSTDKRVLVQYFVNAVGPIGLDWK